MNFTNNKLHFLKEYFLLKFIKSFPIDSKYHKVQFIPKYMCGEWIQFWAEAQRAWKLIAERTSWTHLYES